MRSVPRSPLGGTMPASVSAGGTSKRSRARARVEEQRRTEQRKASAFSNGSIQSAPLTCSASAIAKNSPPRSNSEHRTTIDHSLLANVNQIIVVRAGNLGTQIGADVQIGRQPAVARRPQIAAGGQNRTPTQSSTLVRKRSTRALSSALLQHFDGEERRIVDTDADLLHRGHEKVLAVLAL